MNKPFSSYRKMSMKYSLKEQWAAALNDPAYLFVLACAIGLWIWIL